MVHKPSVGRIVHYFEGDVEAPSHWSHDQKHLWQGTNGTRCHAAIITRVWTETCVNLIVFKDASGPIVRASQNLLSDLAADHVQNGWRWPERVS